MHSNGEQNINLKDKQQRPVFKPGDVTWVRIDDHSWWPAQIVDEKWTNKSWKAKAAVPVRLYGSYEHLFADPGKCNSDFKNHLKQENVTIREVLKKSLEDATRMMGEKSERKAPSAKDVVVENYTCKASKGKKRQRDERKQQASGASSEREAQQEGNRIQASRQVMKDVNSSTNTNRNNQSGSTRPVSKDRRKHIGNKESLELKDEHMQKRASENGDLSARRLRVMLKLNLIAPLGSPFQKSSRITKT